MSVKLLLKRVDEGLTRRRATAGRVTGAKGEQRVGDDPVRNRRRIGLRGRLVARTHEERPVAGTREREDQRVRDHRLRVALLPLL